MKWRSLEESKPGQDLRPLREQLAERKALIEKLVPAATQAVHAKSLKICNVPESPIASCDRARKLQPSTSSTTTEASHISPNFSPVAA